MATDSIGEDVERCNGLCVTAREVMYPPSGGYDPDAVAYAHPDCPLHGEHIDSIARDREEESRVSPDA